MGIKSSSVAKRRGTENGARTQDRSSIKSTLPASSPSSPLLSSSAAFTRRRTLKNRGYAASCRVKRLEQKGDLEHEKGKEYEDLDHVQEDNTRMREEVESLHRKFDALKRFAAKKKLRLPVEFEQY